MRIENAQPQGIHLDNWHTLRSIFSLAIFSRGNNVSANRLRCFDSARGIAMGLVCLSHFILIYSHTSSAHLDFLYFITKLASPTFMVVSGTLLGFMLTTKRDSFDQVQKNYFNRGIFLLTYAHLIIALSHLLITKGHYAEALKYIFITDAVGFNCIVGPVLCRKMNAKKRIMMSIVLITISWTIISKYHPEGIASGLAKEAFWGDIQENNIFHLLNNTFPVLPWFSIFSIATVTGEKAAYLYIKKEAHWERIFIKMGVLLFGILFVIKTAIIAAKHLKVESFTNIGLFSNTSIYQKSPPSIGFLLFYGGIAYFLIFAIIVCQNRNLLTHLFDYIDCLGRNSLFVFIVQFFAYYTLFYYIHARYSHLWPAYFMISFLTILAVAHFWDKSGWNKHLTARIF
jgi:uncharacterized membrane protein